MRAEQNAGALEAPGDHRPLTRDVNPLLTWIAAQQRRQPESEWDGEAGIARVEHGRVNYHLGVLQQRGQTLAVGLRNHLHRAAGAQRAQHFERAGDKDVQDEEEQLHARQHHADVRHQLRVLGAIRIQN